MAESAPTLTPARQSVLVLLPAIRTLMIIGAGIAFFASGLSASLAESLAARFHDAWLPVYGLQILVMLTGFIAVTFPVYLLEETTASIAPDDEETPPLSFWVSDVLRHILTDIGIGGLVFLALFGLITLIPAWWWLIAALVDTALHAVTSGMLDKWFRKPDAENDPLEDEELESSLRSLSKRYDVNIGQWGRLPDHDDSESEEHRLEVKGRQIISVLLPRSILRTWDAEEIMSSVLHRLFYVRRMLTAWNLAAHSLLATASLLVTHLMLLVLSHYQWIESMADPAALPLILASLSVTSLLLHPLLHGLHRAWAFRADAYVVETMKNRGPILRTLRRARSETGSTWIPPLWMELLFISYPDLTRRIRRVRSLSVKKSEDSKP